MAFRAASDVANGADNCYYQMLSDPLQIKRAKKEPFFSLFICDVREMIFYDVLRRGGVVPVSSSL